MTSINHRAVEQFIYREARLQDEHRYDEWEALWTEDAIYWVPAGGEDPNTQVSYIYDNRSRIAGRIRQLKTGRRHAQAPQSRLRRVVSNIEIKEIGDLIEVSSNFILIEARHGVLTTWAGSSTHRLSYDDQQFRMKYKKVDLVNRYEPIDNLAFLI